MFCIYQNSRGTKNVDTFQVFQISLDIERYPAAIILIPVPAILL